MGSELWLHAWYDLDKERERPHLITLKMCKDYAEFYEFSKEQLHDLAYYMRYIDYEFLEWWSKDQKRKAAKK